MSPVAVSVRRELARLPPSLRQGAYDVWKAVVKADRHGEISGILLLFTASLEVPREISLEMSASHFYMWMAYTLYDHLLDGEGDVSTLPLANCLHRAALAHCSDRTMGDVLLIMDDANTWELRNARANVLNNDITISLLPNYSDKTILARRAYGHIAFCVTAAPLDCRRQVSEALSAYVIARQFNDDLHDWVNDLKNGQLTYVVVALLKAAGIRRGTYRLDQLLPNLKRHFWQTELERLCLEVIARIDSAQLMLKSILVANSEFDQRILQPVSRIARQALDYHYSRKQLIARYRGL